jgi:two-component system response regulator NreC
MMKPSKKLKLLLVDDHAVVRFGLRMLLEEQDDFEIAGEASTGREAIEAVTRLQPDIVLMDIGLPDISGIEATREIKKLREETAVVVLTIHEDAEYFFNMLQAGASGYVPKRAAPEELLTAIRAAARDEVYIYPSLAKLLVADFVRHGDPSNLEGYAGLTPREIEVIVPLAEGATNFEIGEKLNISPKTVGRHRENIMAKLNLHSRADLVRYAIRKGIIRP